MRVEETWKALFDACGLANAPEKIQLASKRIFYSGYASAFQDILDALRTEDEEQVNAKMNEIFSEVQQFTEETMSGKTVQQ